MPEPTTLCRRCAFATDRLLVGEWHSFAPGQWHGDLPRAVIDMLTERALAPFPPEWRGAYDESRARSWIAELDRLGSTLLVVEAASREPVGLLILFEPPVEGATGVEVRLGFLFAEGVWGRGFASEAVAGFVAWCRDAPEIASIGAGAERSNVASRRVLEKAGFTCDEDADGDYRFHLAV